jgi:excinuclease ABC subunit B
LREGLDLPEVSLVAILDADKEGFLRNFRSLIQTMGRASRNLNGHVILYADRITDSMAKAMAETERRRATQIAFNAEHGITPRSVSRKLEDDLRDRDPLTELTGATPPDSADSGAGGPVEQSLDPAAVEEQMMAAAARLDFEEAARLRDILRNLK